MIRVFHRTAYAEAILRDGFRDGHGTYLTGEAQSGVFVSDSPVGEDEGAKGEQLLVMDISEGLLAPYEFIDLSGMCDLFREWCVPAEVLNGTQVRLLLGSSVEDAESAGRQEMLRRSQAHQVQLKALVACRR